MFFIHSADHKNVLDIAHIHFESWQAAYSSILPKTYIEQENSLSQKAAMWKAVISHPRVKVWLVHNEAKDYIGFIAYFETKNEFEITTLYVLPSYQGLGIGTRLMNTALNNITQNNDCAKVFLWVLEANISAINFYKKLGFKCEGEKTEESYEGTKIIDIKMIKSV